MLFVVYSDDTPFYSHCDHASDMGLLLNAGVLGCWSCFPLLNLIGALQYI